jgi:hypothetical protein
LRNALPSEYVETFISGQETPTTYLGIYEAKLVYLALAAIKEQNKKIAELEQEIEELKNK